MLNLPVKSAWEEIMTEARLKLNSSEPSGLFQELAASSSPRLGKSVSSGAFSVTRGAPVLFST